jgi:CRP-like cAMP-binding protein
MKVAELGAGAGYTTELLARAVAPDGVVYAQNPDLFVKSFLKDRWPARLSRPAMKNVVRVDREFDDPLPPEAKDLDRVVLRALAKSPAQRYATWGEFALELSRVAQSVLPPDAIPDSEKYVVLKAVPMLSVLSDAELWELARAGRWSRYAKNRAIVREKEKGTSFYFLASGECKVTRQGRLLNMIGAKEFFGEMAYIAGGEARHATVESHTDLLLAEFQPDGLDKMSLGAQLHLMRALVRNVSERLALANTRIAR